ncbi:MAG: hypothetical protein LUG49_08595 [Oscillospiraceae bacterium]|nr:hypothetical protein [Oscillospiraceae bacterium]
MVQELTKLGKSDEVVLSEGADALVVGVIVASDHHRASDELFAGIFFIRLNRKTLLDFGADIDKYVIMSDAKMSIDLLSLVV